MYIFVFFSFFSQNIIHSSSNGSKTICEERGKDVVSPKKIQPQSQNSFGILFFGRMSPIIPSSSTNYEGMNKMK